MKVENGEDLRATLSRFGLIRLAQLFQLLEQHVALQLRQMVDEQHSVQMVHLVLEAGGEQAIKLLVMRDTVIVQPAGADGGGPFHIGEHLGHRSEEHTSELQSLMRISYAVLCLKKQKTTKTQRNNQ